ncbi:hypothetical protein COCOBI_03-0170 [Coccomyxa sp. Obi]|nr:hypothetical protein COCOBI_03-0170 [Coccomyxa sp. Obi]
MKRCLLSKRQLHTAGDVPKYVCPVTKAIGELHATSSVSLPSSYAFDFMAVRVFPNNIAHKLRQPNQLQIYRHILPVILGTWTAIPPIR